MKKSLRGNPILDEIERRIDLSEMLSEEEKSETRKRAIEHVHEQEKDKAVKSLFDLEVKRARQLARPEEGLIDIYVDLPPFAPMVRLDNVVFFHGITYEVTMNAWQSMRDVIARAWEHQSEIEGHARTADSARRHVTTNLSPTAQHGMRVNSVTDLNRI